ncbi:hypothetical protein EG329_003560 [Mollisiaceae sp. DMI_Dod_QoI]|nr:hypothetical protein EG329_003560 [Helotiales sp. DMI_Dod_QoI]
MGRYSKKQKEEILRAQAEETLRLQREYEELDYETPTLRELQSPQKKIKNSSKVTPKVKSKAKKKNKANVEEEQSNQQDGLEVAQRLRHGRNKGKMSHTELVELIKSLAAALSTVGDPEDVKSFLGDEVFPDAETLQSLHSNCHVVKTLLQHLGKLGDTVEQRIPSTIQHYDKYVVYRAPTNLLYLLGVVEVFKPSHSAYSRRKTLGFVRTKGTTMPLDSIGCSLSGTKNVLEDHPRMLDTEFWLKEVMYFAEHLDHEFQRGPWDTYHGMKDGTINASHVEPTLFLSYAYHLVRKFIRVGGDVRKHLKNMWRLRLLGQKFEAELVLSKAPCKPCKKFQKDIEDLTGIEFSYVIMDNVAQALPEKDSIKYEIYPRFAREEDKESFEEAVQFVLEHGIASKKTRERIAVEIPQPQIPRAQIQQPERQTQRPGFHHAKPDDPITSNNDQSAVREPTPIYSRVVTTSKTVQKKEIRKFMYDSPKQLGNTIVLDDDSDGSEWQPSRRSKVMTQSNTPIKRSAPTDFPTPDSEPFSLEARQRAKEIQKKKRQASAFQDSPSASKKSRWSGYI